MSEYLTKEEIRKWRSSLERITLEEYAARLGKIIQEEKHDDSLVDSVMLKSLNSMTKEKYTQKTEKIQSFSIKSFNKEKELQHKKDITTVHKIEVPAEIVDKPEKTEEAPIKSINKQNLQNINLKNSLKEISDKQECITVKEKQNGKHVNSTENANDKNCVSKANSSTKLENKSGKIDKKEKTIQEETAIEEEAVNYSFSKALTPREQLVFDYFLKNKNNIVYAKDLAKILELPRDYVYKYIKNLRSKLNENILQNADNGGYLLKV